MGDTPDLTCSTPSEFAAGRKARQAIPEDSPWPTSKLVDRVEIAGQQVLGGFSHRGDVSAYVSPTIVRLAPHKKKTVIAERRKAAMHRPRGCESDCPALAVAILAAAVLVAVAPAAEDNAYVVHNIISNVPGAADHPEREPGERLGARRRPDLAVVGRRQRHQLFETLYTAGMIVPLVVTVDGGPTGLVFNSGSATSFFVARARGSAGAPTSCSRARTASSAAGTRRSTGPWPRSRTPAQERATRGSGSCPPRPGDRLNATDFANAKVDVVDGAFQPVTVDGAFHLPEPARRLRAVRDPGLGNTVFVTVTRSRTPSTRTRS